MMNEEIRDREVRVIDQNGEQLGVQPIRKALELARKVLVNENDLHRHAPLPIVTKAGLRTMQPHYVGGRSPLAPNAPA